MKKLLVLMMCLLTTSAFAQMLEVKRSIETIDDKIKKTRTKTLKTTPKADSTGTDSTTTKITAIDSDDIDNAEITTDSNLKGLGDYTFNGIRMIPNIKILANRTSRGTSNGTKKLNWYNGAEVFVLQNPKSTEAKEYRVNYFIPEFSSFGIRYTLGWCQAEDYEDIFIGILLNASFLGKDFKKDTISIQEDFSTTNAHVSLGAELVFPGERKISMYGAYNFNGVLTNREAFKKNLSTNQTDYHFLNVGIRAELDLTEETKNNTLALDLGFILQSGKVSDFVGNKDPVIPMIRIGFKHSFLPK
jgi:hypothetical protein